MSVSLGVIEAVSVLLVNLFRFSFNETAIETCFEVARFKDSVSVIESLSDFVKLVFNELTGIGKRFVLR